MPFCPECKNEFQEGTTSCPDCHADLVDSPVPGSSASPSNTVNKFINSFGVTIGKRGIIITAAVMLALIIVTGPVFYFLGEKDGLASAQAKTAKMLSDLRSSIQSKPELNYWMELYGKQDLPMGRTAYISNQYITNEQSRAQSLVPFDIVLPDLSTSQDKQAAPAFRGPVDPQDKSKAFVYIYFAVDPEGIVEITESNFEAVQGYSNFASGTQTSTINGVQVLKSNNNSLAFQSGKVYFIIQSFGTSGEDITRIAESLIRRSSSGN